MAVQTPASPIKLNDNQLDFGSTVAEATMKQIGQNVNQLIDSTPIGTIVAFAVNLNGVSLPNSDIWQLCDGSEITQADSPMRSQGIITNFTPDLTDRFIRGSSIGNQNQFAGADAFSTNVNATTDVQSGPTRGTDNGGDGDSLEGAFAHAHNVSFNVSGDTVPRHYTVAFYIKIN